MTALVQLFIFFFGAIFGSFVNAVSLRLRTGESFLFSRSHCPSCQHTLEALDLVPVASWVLLRGRCRHCRKPISPQYLLMEIAMGLLFVFATFDLPLMADTSFWLPILLFRWYCFAVLALVFLYDLKYLMILRSVTWPALAVAAVANLALGVSWYSMAGAALAAGGFFWIQYRVSGGRWIGGGDAQLGLLMGVMLGWPLVLIALFIAYITGAACGVVMLLTKRKTMESQIPFGTFLALATALTLVFGRAILAWYLGLSV